MGQLLLGLGVLILAGLVLGGGAILLLGGSPRATPTHVATVPTGSGLPTFSTPSPSSAPTPTLLVTPSPSLPSSVPPTATPSPVPTLPPTPTPEPTAAPTPVDCAVASQGIAVKNFQMGLGHATAKLLAKTWCIRHVTIDQWVQWGTARLLNKNQVVYEATCLPTSCLTASQDLVPPYQANLARTLHYEFTCFDDPATPDPPTNECTDATQEGAVITIDYESFAAP